MGLPILMYAHMGMRWYEYEARLGMSTAAATETFLADPHFLTLIIS